MPAFAHAPWCLWLICTTPPRSYGFGHTGLPADGVVTSDLPVVKGFLDNATAHSLQVFFAMNGFFAFPPYNMSQGLNWTTSVVSTFKDHPAICAWCKCTSNPTTT
jgi:hypothetical protein